MDKIEVLATVGSREITQNDVDFLLKTLPPQQAMQFNSEEGKKQLLQEIINQELFYLDAIENKMNADEEFKLEMEKIESNYLKQYAINKLLTPLTITEEEIINYYEANSAQFKKPESVKASHILVEDEASAKEVLAELNTGISFGEVAQKYSKCPSCAQGGDLGYFSKGQMVPEFESAAFSMNVDEISDLVKTQFGYHIIKLVDKKEEEVSSLSEVRQFIFSQLLSQKQQSVYFDKINSLKDVYKIEIKL